MMVIYADATPMKPKANCVCTPVPETTTLLAVVLTVAVAGSASASKRNAPARMRRNISEILRVVAKGSESAYRARKWEVEMRNAALMLLLLTLGGCVTSLAGN